MSAITTHVLDTARGRPASGVPVGLEVQRAEGWVRLGQGVTDADGRLRTLTQAVALEAAVYRLTFETDAYFASCGTTGFYPAVQITFSVTAPSEHHHVPLLLNPFGYSTYRGS